MLGFSPKLPVDDEERLWVDAGFRRLEAMLGRSRMLDSSVVLPNDKFFPDPFDRTPSAVEKLFQRVCTYMNVDPRRIELEIFPDENEELRAVLPYWRGQGGGCAGVYHHYLTEGEELAEDNRKMLIALRSTLIKDPLTLVATIAHELGHVILIGGGLMDPETPDHEPMTDLLTVYLGFGVFNASSAMRFKQFQEAGKQGWSMQRLGYLREEIFGYALARFAAERGERKPDWAAHLSTNVRAFFKRSQAWLAKHPDSIKSTAS